MNDMVSTKMFRTGGSVAVRIPAGWLDPTKPVHLIRQEHTGRIYVSQGDAQDPDVFFNLLRGEGYVEDPAFAQLPNRDDPARAFPPGVDT